MEEKNLVKDKVEKNKKGDLVKVIFAIVIVFLFIPSMVIAGFYFMDDTFMYRVNSTFSQAPGPIGAYFESIPTKSEKQTQINSIAKYFLEISNDRAVDKLILISNEEKGMYDSVIKSMLQMDPNDTQAILEEIRDKKRKGDALSTTLDEITEDRKAELKTIALDLQNMPFTSLRSELYKIIREGLNGKSQLAKILEHMDSVKAYQLLTLIDESDRTDVMNLMSSEAKISIKEEMNKDLGNNQKLISISEIYASKDAKDLVDILGNTSTYSVSELAVIYKEIGILKTGKILAKVEDAKLVNNIISEMKNNEVLENGEDVITKDILKTLNIYKEFDDNILQLTNVYSSMLSEEISGILKRLITNSALPQVYVLDNGEIIEITDEELAIRILRNFDDKRIAAILGFYGESLASEISKKLTVPEY